MFNSLVDATIDQVVVAKKAVNKTISPTKDVNKIFDDFVDAQAKYTREAVKAGTDLVTNLGQIAFDRTPYVEAAKSITKFFPFSDYTSSSKKNA